MFFYAVGDAERTNENELVFTSRYENVDSDENSVSDDKMILESNKTHMER